MGLLGPYIYENKNNKKFWLHMTKRGKLTLYYFSKDPRGSINNMPKGYMVVENPTTGFPFLKKKTGGGLGGMFKKIPDKKVVGSETTETPQKGG